MAAKPSLPALGLALCLACGGGPPASAPATPPAGDEDTPKPAAAPAPAAPRPVALDSSLIPQPGAPLEREVFAYRGGSRDPFASLLEGRSAGPELGDLDVVGIMFAPQNPGASVATLWDRVNLKQYTAHEGERVGRARVVSITERAVRFTIDDFGTQREVTLAIRKREDVP